MNPIRTWMTRCVARTAYFATNRRAGEVLRCMETADATDPTTRGRILTEAAGLEYQLGGLVAGGWRQDVLEDGRTLEGAHYDASRLMELVASTETATSHADRDTEPVWEPDLGLVLDDLTQVTDPAMRAELMTRLYLAAHPLVGGQAAEAIESLRRAYLRLALNHPQGQAATAAGSAE